MSRLVSRLTATAAVTGALLGAAVLPAAAADHGRYGDHDHGRDRGQRAQVVLGDVHQGGYDRDRHHRGTRMNDEWIEVVNIGRRAVDLEGWTLSDEDHHTYRFAHLWLGARDSVRVHTGYGRDTRSDVYQDRRGSLWDDEDGAILRDDRGRVVDTEFWGDREHRR